MNEYFEDAAYFSRRCAAAAYGTQTRENVTDGLLFFGFAVERLLKGYLFEIDPRLVLKNDKWENAINVYHKDKQLKPNDVCEKEADRDTIAFRTSLTRAQQFLRYATKNKALLQEVADLRGIVAHSPLSWIDVKRGSYILERYFQPCIRSLADECGVGHIDWFGKLEAPLKETSAEIEANEQIEDRARVLLETHRKNWDALEATGDEDDIRRRQDLTKLKIESGDVDGDFYVGETCPACGQTAVVRGTVDWEVEGTSGSAEPVGVSVVDMRCEFCGLDIDDFELIDHFEIASKSGRDRFGSKFL